MITRLGNIWSRLRILCRGEADEIAIWFEESSIRWPLLCCGIITLGCGCYGATIGLWRSPLQALYSGVKFPLLMFLTLLTNSLLNGMMAQLLGLGLTFRQTSLAILMSFTVVAMFLAAFAPISLFILYNTPPLTAPSAVSAHLFIKLNHVVAISYAGITANIRLYRLLTMLSGNHKRSRKTLFTWMTGNLFLGSQLAWIFRPFVGSPFLDVQFLRDDAFNGNFYENVLEAMKQLLS